MDGYTYNPIQQGQVQNGMNSGSAMEPWAVTDQGLSDGYGTNLQTGITTGIDPTQGGSWYDNMMGAGSMGKGGFMSSLPGYAISAFAAYDRNKTNKLNRKATQYALDRKKTEDKAYDKFQSGWSNVKF